MLKVFSVCVILLGLPGLQGVAHTPVTVMFKYHHVDVKSWTAVEAYLQQNNIRSEEVADLTFFKCDLTQLPDWVVEKMPNLKLLNISYNKFKKIPETIAHLTKLRHLAAGNNELTEFPSFLSKLPALHSVDFRGNRLKNISKSSLNLPNLTLLVLSNNQIGTLPDLSGLKNLQGLLLEHNEDIRFEPASKPLDSLDVLDLSHCHLKTVPSFLGDISSLSKLNLEGNPLLKKGFKNKLGKDELKKKFEDKVQF